MADWSGSGFSLTLTLHRRRCGRRIRGTLAPADHSRRVAGDERVRRNGFVDDRAGGDDRALADGDAGHDEDTGPQPHIVLDPHRLLLPSLQQPRTIRILEAVIDGPDLDVRAATDPVA